MYKTLLHPDIRKRYSLDDLEPVLVLMIIAAKSAYTSNICPKDGPPESITKHFAYRLAESRFAFAGKKVSCHLLGLLAVICDTPGEVVLWVHAICTSPELEEEAKKNDGEYTVLPLLNLFNEDDPTDAFFPSKELIKEVWRSQKVVPNCMRTDNYVDTKEAYTNHISPA